LTNQQMDKMEVSMNYSHICDVHEMTLKKQNHVKRPFINAQHKVDI